MGVWLFILILTHLKCSSVQLWLFSPFGHFRLISHFGHFRLTSHFGHCRLSNHFWVYLGILGLPVILDIVGFHIIFGILGLPVILDIIGFQIIFGILGLSVIFGILGLSVILGILGPRVILDIIGFQIFFGLLIPLCNTKVLHFSLQRLAAEELLKFISYHFCYDSSPRAIFDLWSSLKEATNLNFILLFVVGFETHKKFKGKCLTQTVWPDWAIYWTLGNFSKPVEQLFCPNLSHSQANFVKVSKSIIFLVKSFLGNFYRHLATFYCSHWTQTMKLSLFIGSAHIIRSTIRTS